MTTLNKEQLIVKINTLPEVKLAQVAELVAKLTAKENEEQDEFSLLIETTNKKYEKVWEALGYD